LLIENLQNHKICSHDDGQNTMLVCDNYPPQYYETQLSEFLFFQPAHLLTQGENIRSFFLVRNASNKLIAEFHCSLSNPGCWESLRKAPFGGLCFDDSCSGKEMTCFLQWVKNYASDNMCKRLTIKSPPACYNPQKHEQAHRSYTNTGFSPVSTLINYYIPVNKTDFSSLIGKSEVRRLRKSERAGFQARLDVQTTPNSIYEFIHINRSKIGYPISISSAELQTLTQNFPENFLTFTATEQEKLIALIVAVRVTPHVLYVFLSCFDRDYSTFSPIVLVMKRLYEFCQQQGCTILDLGTSLDHHGQHKDSLVRFKQNLGAKECMKVLYQADF
jgi:hypothetical protein